MSRKNANAQNRPKSPRPQYQRIRPQAPISWNDFNNNPSKKNVEEDFEEMSFSKQGGSGIRLINKLVYKNDAQARCHAVQQENTVSFLIGPAGSAKSFFAVYEMVLALIERRVTKGIITRPTVAAGNDLGAMPGNSDDKMAPWMRPVIAHLHYFLGEDQTRRLLEEKVIEIIPVQHARGLNYDDCYVVVDETQNCTCEQLQLLLTRIGFNAKVNLTFDPDQIDIKYKENSCVYDIWRFGGEPGIGFHEFTEADIVRSEICRVIVGAYKKELTDLKEDTDEEDS